MHIHGISTFWRVSAAKPSRWKNRSNSGQWMVGCWLLYFISSSYHHPIEWKISNSHGCGPSSGDRNSEISFPLMRKIVLSRSTQCSIPCTFATAIRSEGHVLPPSYLPLFLYPLLKPSNSDSIFSKSLFLRPRWGRHCSFVLLCSLCTPPILLMPMCWSYLFMCLLRQSGW